MNPPIFIIGAPRSGTTLLLDLLSAHRHFAWISGALNREPARLRLARRNRLYDLPLVGEALFRQRYAINRLPSPVEPWNFWEHLLPGFRHDHAQPSPQARQWVERVCALQKKPVLLSKHTDFPRVHLLRAVFPGARFIHIQRDPRAVAASYAKRVLRGEFAEWNEKEQWLTRLPEELRQCYASVSDTPLNLTAVLTRWFIALIQEETATLPPADLARVDYHALCAEPAATCHELLEHFGLPPCARLDRYIAGREIRNMDHKWREELSDTQQHELERVLHDT